MEKIQWIERKIIRDKDNLQRLMNTWRATGKKIVFTNGCFDILHHGHLDLLARAADMGNVLVVGLNTDASVKRLKGNDRPVTHEEDRLFQMASLLCVDAVCLFDEDTPEALIHTIRPDVLVKGGDYTIDTIVGAPFVIGNGGSVQVVPFVQGYSTTGLIANIKKL
ncbi:D-glycero-beta-D-manno-heptose 1-phosphate adenylyltransferase [Chitinophagaceae bacterium IBVUCB1]|nr:D-glycero-beta-D-manno-heptose 1-phosphate adenylyltransferase [Chitinophagaceae bacterium IBVUCB1]